MEKSQQYVCRVLVRWMPETMCMGKGMAQTHHAGVQMVFKNFDRNEVKIYCSQLEADGFGTTLTLMAADPRNDANRIEALVGMARDMGYVADVVVDTSYPVGDGLTVNALTCGYILCPVGDTRIETLISRDAWILYKRD